MFEAYWGLKRGPFSDESARQALAASPAHAEAMARLDFLLESRGRLGLLLGAAGSGKSLVLAELARRLERSGCEVASVAAAHLGAGELLAALATGLRASEANAAGKLWLSIADRLEELRLENVTGVILLDDFDRTPAETRAVVERLLALADAPLSIVASGRPESVGRIGRGLLEQAALRIDLAPWNEDETRDYLHATLKQAGRQQPAFDPLAVRRLFELSGGAPRKVNQLAQLALVAGAGQGLLQVDAETIEAVEEELSLGR